MALTENALVWAYIGDVNAPNPWTPGANTVAYYPLRTNLADASWNLNNLTDNGWAISTTFVNDGVASIDVAYIRSYLQIPTRLTVDITKWFTYSLWCRWTAFGSYRPHFVACKWSSSGGTLADVQVYNWSWNVQIYTDYPGFSYDRTQIAFTTSYDLWTATLDTDWTLTFYRNGASVWVKATNINSNKNIDYFVLWPGRESSGTSYPIYASDFIIEDKPRTAQEVASYYNQSKSNYTIPLRYSIDFTEEDTEAKISSAWWTLWNDGWTWFDSDWIYQTSSNKHMMVYKTVDLSTLSKVHIESNCLRNTDNWGWPSIGFFNANNIYTPVCRWLLESNSLQYMWNDSRTSISSNYTNWEYKMVMDLDLSTWVWAFSVTGTKAWMGTWSLTSANLATLKQWNRVGMIIDQGTSTKHHIKDVAIYYE